MKVYVDANPKMAGFVSEDGDTDILYFAPEKTNNEAEYTAVAWALTKLKDVTEILSDSQLIVNQLNRKYHIKEDRLRFLARRVWDLAKGRNVKFTWVPRKENLAGKLLG